MRSAFLCLGLISASYLPAQQTSVIGPVEAVTYDAPTRSLRQVIGLPGAASFGPAILDNIDIASVAPMQTYGIVSESQKWLVVSNLGSKTLASRSIQGVVNKPDSIVWSADGTVAILYSLTNNWFQVISGLPAAPTAGALVDVSTLGGSFSAIAMDTAGKQIAVAITGSHSGVYQFSGGEFSALSSIANPVSLSFSSDAQTLYALDAANLDVSAIKLNGSSTQILALAGMTNPIAIQSLVDSQNRPILYIAGGSDRLLRILDLSNQQVLNDLPLNFQPNSLSPFGSGSFVLASRSKSSNPLWLFASTPLPSAYFVPAVQLRAPDHPGVAAIAGRAR